MKLVWSRARLGPALAMLMVAGMATANQVSEDPLDRKVLDIAAGLRCAVCQNQPVSESNSDLARDMRVLIREKVQAGQSREQIVDYFVARYGDYVLMKPPTEGAGLPLWLLPLAILAVLAISALVFIRRRMGALLPPPATLSAEDRARIERARQQDEAP
jgi:cytochrome c-type biogenesis protein CcmH